MSVVGCYDTEGWGGRGGRWGRLSEVAVAAHAMEGWWARGSGRLSEVAVAVNAVVPGVAWKWEDGDEPFCLSPEDHRAFVGAFCVGE